MDEQQNRKQLPAEHGTPEQPLSSQGLLNNRKAVWIEHNQEMYCLRLTRQNKLLLTK